MHASCHLDAIVTEGQFTLLLRFMECNHFESFLRHLHQDFVFATSLESRGQGRGEGSSGARVETLKEIFFLS